MENDKDVITLAMEKGFESIDLLKNQDVGHMS